MGIIELFLMEGRPKEIAKILGNTLDKECKEDSLDDIMEALEILKGVGVLKRDDTTKKEGKTKCQKRS